MITFWITILALLAGPDGRTPVEARASSRIPLAARPASTAPEPGRPGLPTRPPGRRPSSTPWSVSGVDELDTEELGESWLLQLDALELSDDDREDWSVPRSLSSLRRPPGLPATSRLRIPLRC